MPPIHNPQKCLKSLEKVKEVASVVIGPDFCRSWGHYGSGTGISNAAGIEIHFNVPPNQNNILETIIRMPMRCCPLHFNIPYRGIPARGDRPAIRKTIAISHQDANPASIKGQPNG